MTEAPVPAPPSEHRIVAACLRDLIAAAPQAQTARQVLTAAEVRRAQLRTGEGALRFDHLYRALDTAYQHDLIPVPGLQIGLRRSSVDYGLYGAAVMAATRLGDSLRMAQRFFSGAWRYVRLDVLQEAGQVINRWTVQPSVLCHPVPVLQAVTSLSISTLRELEQDLHSPALSLRYGFARPRDAELYRRLLPCRITFGAAATELRFPLEWLERPLPAACAANRVAPATYSLALKAWHGERTAGPWADRVRWYLRHPTGEGFPDLADVAAHCGVAPRTLRQHLQDEGLHFQAVRAEVRMGLAYHYLRHSTVPIEELAQQLGYAHPPSFSRAVRSHFGLPPQALRQGTATDWPDHCD